MRTRSRATKQDVASDEVVLSARANELFSRAVEISRQTERGIANLGQLIAELRENNLWKYDTTKEGQGRFASWPEVVQAVVGPMADRKLYELTDCYSLTKGPNPIPAEEVEQYGIKRAVEVARLRPDQRTPEIRKMAKTEPVMLVRNRVQAILNEELPKDQQKPMLKLLAINLPENLVQEFEKLLEVLGHTDGARDGDDTQTIRHKAFNLLLIGAREYWALELADALKRMKAEAAANDSRVAEAQEGEDFPDEGNEIEGTASEEVASPKHSKDSDNVRRPRQLVLAK